MATVFLAVQKAIGRSGLLSRFGSGVHRFVDFIID